MASFIAASVVLLAVFAQVNAAVWNNDGRYTNWNLSPGAKDRNGQTNIPVFLEDAAYRAGKRSSSKLFHEIGC